MWTLFFAAPWQRKPCFVWPSLVEILHIGRFSLSHHVVNDAPTPLRTPSACINGKPGVSLHFKGVEHRPHNQTKMEEELRYIEGLVGEIKAELFSPTADLCSLLLSLSAYHTAWVAMVPDPEYLDRPMFSECLDWILDNQKMDTDGGFWGSNQGPTIHCLADTIACLVALKTWNVDSSKIEQGIWFLHSNMEKMLMSTKLDDYSTIVLAGMIELAQDRGLEVLPPDGNKEVMNNFILQRDRLLETTEHCGTNGFDLGMFIEVLPANYKTEHTQTVREKLDRSNFRLPSAAAYSFMTTGDNNCIDYLRNVVQRRRDGAVHPLYPTEEELIKLILVDHLERLGCGLSRYEPTL